MSPLVPRRFMLCQQGMSKRAGKLLSDDDRRDLILYLAAYPRAGDLIEGTGGVRKLRWGRDGRT